MAEETIAHFLDELASGAPVPGGGATAALEAALHIGGAKTKSSGVGVYITAVSAVC